MPSVGQTPKGGINGFEVGMMGGSSFFRWNQHNKLYTSTYMLWLGWLKHVYSFGIYCIKWLGKRAPYSVGKLQKGNQEVVTSQTGRGASPKQSNCHICVQICWKIASSFCIDILWFKYVALQFSTRCPSKNSRNAAACLLPSGSEVYEDGLPVGSIYSANKIKNRSQCHTAQVKWQNMCKWQSWTLSSHMYNDLGLHNWKTWLSRKEKTPKTTVGRYRTVVFREYRLWWATKSECSTKKKKRSLRVVSSYTYWIMPLFNKFEPSILAKV